MAATQTTYRVQGIPANASFDDVKTIISKAFDKDGVKANPTIHSLASDPYSPVNNGTKVATVTFAQTPGNLKNRGEVTAIVPWGYESHRIFVDSSFQGFTSLNDAEDDSGDTIDIIAVSGLSSHPFGSWKERGGTFMWLRDEVAKTAKRARVLLYGYDTTLVNSESFQDIGDIATRLSSDVNAIRGARSAQEAFVPTPIVFIAHSLGGLVVKEYPDDFLSIYGLLFFGVPNGGIKTEYWMPIVDRMPNRGLITSLEPDAYYLRNLQHTQTPFNQNHSGLPKFRSKYDANYKAIEPFFTECYNDAFEVIQKRFIAEGLSHHLHSHSMDEGLC
ncbi:uncharacterized protein TRIVIDRAFT_64038 [Trichoderma virens Gv29-8]|uniref:Uncharacterized protein n=1 Tax=Hypocrea virens (strain Gv29-8 / FGSC 10586) TaxID=413071 RepID=G9MNS2_HYPVG|nr:uncharacterized protein TRIVIDRAFT_64038 [Trichoderma virens Gv29-8]EHK23526.1 hypothetical protein TRIVIDRAFT_64038 [Trichoderma virens Gv29-8]UKZ49821.1 hypothetical protein TrVGV298_004074 [Trichoderma virens]